MRHGPYDWMFIKVKPNGANDFVKLLGTPADDKCYSLIQSSVDSGYVLAGYMYHQATAQKRATLVKALTNSGNLMYTKFIYDSLGSSYSQIVNDPSNTRGLAGYDERYISTKARKKNACISVRCGGNKNWAYRIRCIFNHINSVCLTGRSSTLCYQPASNTLMELQQRQIFIQSGWTVGYSGYECELCVGAVNWKKFSGSI